MAHFDFTRLRDRAGGYPFGKMLLDTMEAYNRSEEVKQAPQSRRKTLIGLFHAMRSGHKTLNHLYSVLLGSVPVTPREMVNISDYLGIDLLTLAAVYHASRAARMGDTTISSEQLLGRASFLDFYFELDTPHTEMVNKLIVAYLKSQYGDSLEREQLLPVYESVGRLLVHSPESGAGSVLGAPVTWTGGGESA